MRSRIYIYEASAQFEVPVEVIPKGRRRHQLDFTGTEGTAEVEINFGAGYRSIKNEMVADTSRLPISLDAVITGIRITPSNPITIAYIIDAEN